MWGGDAVCVSRSLCLRVSGGWLKPEKQRKVLSNALPGSGSLKSRFETVKPHWYSYMPYYRGMAYSDRI